MYRVTFEDGETVVIDAPINEVQQLACEAYINKTGVSLEELPQIITIFLGRNS